MDNQRKHHSGRQGFAWWGGSIMGRDGAGGRRPWRKEGCSLLLGFLRPLVSELSHHSIYSCICHHCTQEFTKSAFAALASGTSVQRAAQLVPVSPAKGWAALEGEASLKPGPLATATCFARDWNLKIKSRII